MDFSRKNLLLLIFFGLFSLSPAFVEEYNEELMIKPLTNGYLYSYFQFTTLWEAHNDAETLKHTHLFPRGLAEIISRHHVDELHISLTEGLWNYEKYGYPFVHAGPGAEISAWFNRKVKDVDQEWKGLTNALSGLLCASLNFINPSNSLSPEFSFKPSGAVVKELKSSHLRYASLPRETACTENLTPFKKLLPCDSRKGLATLLNSAYIHNTNYHSVGIHFRTTCASKNITCTPALELKLTISLVYDTVAFDTEGWSTRKLFGIGLREPCPLASNNSFIYVDLSGNGTTHKFELSPAPDLITQHLRGGQENKYGIYSVKSNETLSITAVQLQKSPSLNYPPILYANRYIIGNYINNKLFSRMANGDFDEYKINGYGQEKGSLVTKIYNNFWQPLNIVLLENIPWYLPLYLHSIKITCNGRDIKPLAQRYIPGKERKQPYYLELLLRLPARSVTKFSVDIDYMFLKWQEYPPDANHGFYMGPAIITAMLPVARNYTSVPRQSSHVCMVFLSNDTDFLVQLRTESILISLPTPDFSMPYNVICLACTAVALAFGPLHNISTKRLVLKRIEKQSYFLAGLARLRRFIGLKEKTA